MANEPKFEEYDVLVAALTLQTDEIDPQTHKRVTVRLLKGSVLRAPADYPSIANLLTQRAIAPHGKVKEGTRITARTVYTVWAKAAHDAMTEVDREVEPLPANAQERAEAIG